MRDEFTNSKGEKKWWYQIAVMCMICVFFVGIDVY